MWVVANVPKLHSHSERIPPLGNMTLRFYNLPAPTKWEVPKGASNFTLVPLAPSSLLTFKDPALLQVSFLIT